FVVPFAEGSRRVLGFTRVSDAVAVRVELVSVGLVEAVVAAIARAVGIGVGLHARKRVGRVVVLGAVVADVPGAVLVAVRLIGIGKVEAVVAFVADVVLLAVLLRRVDHI